MNTHRADYLRYIVLMLNGPRSKIEREIAERRNRDIGPYVGKASSLRILDLAIGSLQPPYTPLKAAGHRVYGIDLVNRARLNGTNLAYRVARQIFIWKLSIPARDLKPKTLVCGSTTVIPFRENGFDLVTSVVAFEQFLDVPAVVAELQRVLQPGGLAWIGIHLFSSLSGGNDFNLTEVPLRTLPSGIEPWDHLRKKPTMFRVRLNEWRPDQYVDLVARHFKILNQYGVMREGEEFLIRTQKPS